MRRHLVISGRVQGVFYRDTFVAQARRLGLAGWVRNRADGTVEALVEGSDSAVAAIVAAAWVGSPASDVSHVEVAPAESDTPLDGFGRRPSA